MTSLTQLLSEMKVREVFINDGNIPFRTKEIALDSVIGNKARIKTYVDRASFNRLKAALVLAVEAMKEIEPVPIQYYDCEWCEMHIVDKGYSTVCDHCIQYYPKGSKHVFDFRERKLAEISRVLSGEGS